MKGLDRGVDLARVVAELRLGIRTQLLEILLDLLQFAGQPTQTVLADSDILEVSDRGLERFDVVADRRLVAPTSGHATCDNDHHEKRANQP